MSLELGSFLLWRRPAPLRCFAIAAAMVALVACSGEGQTSALGASPGDESSGDEAAEDGSSSSASGEQATAADESPPVQPDPALTLPTSPVPPPQPGSITQVVPTGEQHVLPVVELTDTVDVDDAIVVELVAVERTEAEARILGEISGPAVLVRVRLTNASGAPVAVGGTTVAVSDADDAPLSPLSGPPADPLLDAVEAHGSVEGIYVFSDPDARTDQLTISVSYAADAPVAVFSGILS